ETRFLTNQQGEWYGYSYVWNDDQTEGTLVEVGGMDHDYTIKTKDGMKTQKWHYPSRTECMVCHSRAANWVLGLSELQMNKVHDYKARPSNQLRTLEHLGAFRINYLEHLEETKRLTKQNMDLLQHGFGGPLKEVSRLLPA